MGQNKVSGQVLKIAEGTQNFLKIGFEPLVLRHQCATVARKWRKNRNASGFAPPSRHSGAEVAQNALKKCRLDF